MNPMRPPFLGATDPEGQDTNFAFDVSPKRMAPSVSFRAYLDTIVDQGQEGTCVGRAVSGAIDTFTKLRGQPLSSSWTSIYSGGYRQQYGYEAMPRDGGLESSLVALQWANRRGVLSDTEWDDAKGYANIPDNILALAAGRTVDFAQLLTGSRIVNSIKAALQVGCPVVINMDILHSFGSLSGPLESQPAQYHYPYKVGPVMQDYAGRHCMYILGDIDGVGFIGANSWGVGFADQGLYCIGYDTLAANTFAAHAITRVASLTSAPIPATMKALPCPGRGLNLGEPSAVQFTLNIRRAMEAMYGNPALTTDKQRAQAVLDGMAQYGVTRDEVAFCHPLPRATLDAFLAQAGQPE